MACVTNCSTAATSFLNAAAFFWPLSAAAATFVVMAFDVARCSSTDATLVQKNKAATSRSLRADAPPHRDAQQARGGRRIGAADAGSAAAHQRAVQDGVGDEDEDIIGLAVGYLVGCMQAKKGLKRSQRGCRVNLTFS